MFNPLKCIYNGDRRPVALELRSSKYFVLASVCTAVFTDLFLYGVIIPVMPFALQAYSGVNPDEIQFWTAILLSIMGAALLVSSPIFGWLCDRLPSRKIPFFAGALLSVAATVMLSLASGLALYIAARVCQGLASALVWIGGLSLLVDSADKHDLGLFMGYASTAMSLAMLVAPLLGGAVFSRAGYVGVFAMCWALLGVDILLRLLLIERRAAEKWLGSGDFTFVDAFAADTKALVADRNPNPRSSLRSFASGTSAAPSDLSSVHSIAAYAGDDDDKTPEDHGYALAAPTRLPALLVLLGQPRLAAALLGCFAHAALLTALEATLPLIVRTAFGWDALAAGAALVPLALPALLAPLAGRLAQRCGPRYVAAGALALAAPPLVLLRLVDADDTAHKAGLCAILAAVGACLALAQAPLMAEMAAVVGRLEHDAPGRFGPRGALGRAHALFNVAFAGGLLVGPVWGGLVNQRYGWATMGWSLGLLAGVAAVPVLLLVGGPVWKTVGRKYTAKELMADEEAAVVSEKV